MSPHERLPIYREVATVTVETDGRSAEDVAAEVREQVERLEGRPTVQEEER